MNDEQLLRYSRHILLPSIDIEGQQTLLESHVAIIGLGGLGSPVAMYLAAAGVAKLTLIDDDKVDLSNLQRQVIHDEANLGQAKVESAAQRVNAMNSETDLTIIAERLTEQPLAAIVDQVDIVIDCSDNFATRFLLNKVTWECKTPLVSGAAIRMEGQVTVFDPRQQGSACYQCVYHDEGELAETCSQRGVLSPLLGIIGSVQAVETLKLLINIGEPLTNRLLILDALSMSWREIKLQADPECSICGKGIAAKKQ